MDNILFIVSDFIAGTNVRRGERIAKHLKLNGVKCEVTDQIPKGIKNTILIFIGSVYDRYRNILSISKVKELKLNGNKIVIDPVDKLTYIGNYIEEESAYYHLLDGIIYPNKFSQQHFHQNLTCKSTVIYHQYDPRFNYYPIKKSPKFNISYVGVMYQDFYLFNPPSWLDVTNIEIMKDVEEMLNRLIKSPIHFSHRSSQIPDFYFKPTNKLASASATNSVFLTSKDKAVVELLGKDYPLYIDENTDKTNKLVDYLKLEFEKDNLDQYIKLLNPIKEKLNINNICKEYIKFFSELQKN